MDVRRLRFYSPFSLARAATTTTLSAASSRFRILAALSWMSVKYYFILLPRLQQQLLLLFVGPSSSSLPSLAPVAFLVRPRHFHQKSIQFNQSHVPLVAPLATPTVIFVLSPRFRLLAAL